MSIKHGRLEPVKIFSQLIILVVKGIFLLTRILVTTYVVIPLRIRINICKFKCELYSSSLPRDLCDELIETYKSFLLELNNIIRSLLKIKELASLLKAF